MPTTTRGILALAVILSVSGGSPHRAAADVALEPIGARGCKPLAPLDVSVTGAALAADGTLDLAMAIRPLAGVTGVGWTLLGPDGAAVDAGGARRRLARASVDGWPASGQVTLVVTGNLPGGEPVEVRRRMGYGDPAPVDGAVPATHREGR